MKVIKEDYSNLSKIIFSIWLSNQNRYLSIKNLRAKADNELNELSNIEIKNYVNSNMNTPEFYNLRSSNEDISCSVESYKNLCRDQNRVILTAGVPHSTTYHEIDVKDLNNYLNNLKLLPLKDNQYHVFGSNPINVEFKGCGAGGFESILYPLQIGEKIAYLANRDKHGLQDSGLDFSKVRIWNLDYFNDVKDKYEEIYKDQSWLGFGFYQESINKESKLKEDIQNLDRVKDLQPVENPVMADAQQDSKEKAKEAKKLTDPMELKNQKAFLGANKQPVPKDAKVPNEATTKMYSLDESLFEDVIEEEAFTDRAAYCFDFAKEYITDNLLIDGVESNLALVLASKDPDYDPEWCSDDVYGNRLERDRNNYVRSLLNDLFANAPVEENESLKEDLASYIQHVHDKDEYLWNLHGTDYSWLYNELKKYGYTDGSYDSLSIADCIRKMPRDKQEEILIRLVEPFNESLDESFDDDFFSLVIEWIMEHDQAADDFVNYFHLNDIADETQGFISPSDMKNSGISVEDVLGWISDHPLLADDFENHFNISLYGEEDLPESLDEAKKNPNFDSEKFGKYFDEEGKLIPELAAEWEDEYHKTLEEASYGNKGNNSWRSKSNKASKEDKEFENSLFARVDNELHAYGTNYEMPNQGHRYTNTGIGRDGIEIYGASEDDFDFAKKVADHFGLDFRIYKTPGNAGTKTALTGVVVIPEEMYDEKPEETAARLNK